MDDLDNIVSLRLITHNVRLVRARKDRGLTQVQMAELVGVPLHHLSQIENLKILPNENEMDDLADELGQTIDYLFPETLLNAIRGGVFSNKYRELDEVEVISLAEVERERLSYDGETLMIEGISRDMLKEEILALLDTMRDPRAKQVIIRRFGLDGEGSHTLEEVGREFGVLRERIRQIEAKALRKLRHPSRARYLADYLV